MSQTSSGVLASTGQNIWEDARKLLSEEDRDVFSLALTQKMSCQELLRDVLNATDERKKEFLERRAKFNLGQKEIFLRDVLSRLAVWVYRFVAVGDAAVQYDPGHAALPWAAIRFVLMTSVKEDSTYGSILAGVESIADMISRCAIVENLYLSKQSDIIERLRRALVNLYAQILSSLSKCVQYFKSSMAKKITKSVFTTSDKNTWILPVTAKLEEVEKEQALAESEVMKSMADGLSDFASESRNRDEQLQDLLKGFSAPMSKIDVQVADIRNSLEADKRGKILGSISKILHKSHHADLSKGRLSESGKWLLEKREFRDWREDTGSSILWLRGLPGAGKTKLTSLVVDELAGERLAFFYCNRNPAERKRALAEPILSSLVLQLACATDEMVFDTIRLRYLKALKGSERFEDVTWTIEQSVQALIDLTSFPTSTVLVLDALDEVEPLEIDELLEALLKVMDKSGATVKIFFSSRDSVEINDHLKDHPNFYVDAYNNSADIEAFVNQQVKSLRLLKKNETLRNLVVETLIGRAQGMFRWVELQIQMLQVLRDPMDVEARLGKLPKTLDQSYWEIFDRIQESGQYAAKLATRTFQWLLVGGSTMYLSDFAKLASIDSHNQDFYTADYFLEICLNLVTCDNGSGSAFQFSHLSVREFLEKSTPERKFESFLPQSANAAIASLCLFNLSAQSELNSAQELYDCSDSLGYAAMRWADHVPHKSYLSLSVTLKSQILAFMLDGSSVSPRFRNWIRQCKGFLTRFTVDDFWGKTTREAAIAAHPIWLLDAFDLVECEELKMPEIDNETQKHVQGLAFKVANFSMIEKMLRTGLYLDCISHVLSNTPETPELSTEYPVMSCRAYVDDRSLMQALQSLQDRRALLEKWVADFFVALHDASNRFILFLHGKHRLRKDSSLQKQAFLQIKSSSTNVQAVMMKILSGLHDYPQDAEQMMLQVKDIIRLSINLTRKQVRYDSKPHQHTMTEKRTIADRLTVPERKTALHEFADLGISDIVQSLLAYGAKVNTRDSNGRTPLHLAKDSKTALLLLENGAEVNARDNDSATPLLSTGDNDTMVLLLENGAQALDYNELVGTPLHLAAAHAKPRTVQLLLEKGIQVDARNIDLETPLHCAASSGPFSNARVLLKNGAQVSTTDIDSRTPLHRAAIRVQFEIVKILLAYGADPKAKDEVGRTPGDFAERGSRRIGKPEEKMKNIAKYLADFESLPANQRPKRSDYDDAEVHSEESESEDENKARSDIPEKQPPESKPPNDPQWSDSEPSEEVDDDDSCLLFN